MQAFVWKTLLLVLAFVPLTGCQKPNSSKDSSQPPPNPEPEPQGQESHGGDRIASLFVAKGYRVYDYLASLTAEEAVLNGDEMYAFLMALKRTRVDPVEGPLMDSVGDVVDARVLDDPLIPGQKLIQLDSQRWEEALSHGEDVYKLVFHEYLWVIGLDDQNYRISNKLRIVEPSVGGVGRWSGMSEAQAPQVDFLRRGADFEIVQSPTSLVLIQSGSSVCNHSKSSVYDLASNSWSEVQIPGTPAIGAGFAAVAAGDEVFVWSGFCAGQGENLFNHLRTGFMFTPSTGAWRPIDEVGAPEGRREGVTVATSWGVFIWGGVGASGQVAGGAMYDAAANQWRAISTEGAPAAGAYRGEFVSANKGGRLAGKIVLWQIGRKTCEPLVSTYDPVADAWASLPAPNSPTYACDWDRAVWADGSFAFLFEYAQQRGDGKKIAGVMWDIERNSWTDVAHEGAPEYRTGASLTWAGDRLLVFGGKDIDGLALNTGKVYLKGSAKWRPLRADEAPLARSSHAAFWTGKELVVWGGLSVLDSPMRTGAIWSLNP